MKGGREGDSDSTGFDNMVNGIKANELGGQLEGLSGVTVQRRAALASHQT